ncbi:MAG TPA: SMP-30/gluconolactonase/LRE family protein [Bacteriovoracaceae bacterium]|nr:SMP-30/gluconolactonase/LRE family protein [Bacteriovoracaceae bacterium]
MKLLILPLLLSMFSCSGVSQKPTHHSITLPAEPKVAFTVTDGILHPESAIYSVKHDAIFVSNIASGNPLEKNKVSYLSRLTADGKIIQSQWVKDLKAPKGLAIVGDHLYVADMDRILKIDINHGKILKETPVPGAKFLNDVVADAQGNIYVSDMFDNTIYLLNDKGLKPWKIGKELNSPNGLYTDGKEHLIVSSWGSDVDPKTFLAKIPGTVVSYSLNASGKTATVPAMNGHFDGISADQKGNLWVSDWISGDIYEVSKSGKAQKRYNLGQGTADITVAKELGLLLIPQMNQNKVIAIYLE